MAELKSDFAVQDRALIAFRRAVEKVMQENLQLGMPAHILENGNIVEISPEEIKRRYLSKTKK